MSTGLCPVGAHEGVLAEPVFIGLGTRRRRTHQRLARLGAVLIVAASMAACGGEPAKAPPPAGPVAGATTVHEVFGDACARLPKSGEPGSLTAMAGQPAATAISAVPDLSFARGVLEAGEKIRELNTARGMTVFVPDNNAVEMLRKRIGDHAFRSVFDDQPTALRVVNYYIINRRLDRDGLIAAGTLQPLLPGSSLRVGKSGDTISVTDDSGDTATVTCGNIPTLNATVYILDRMLVPRGYPILQQQQNPWTCAPSNDAYNHAEICRRTTTPTS